jgi:hypothetical protein
MSKLFTGLGETKTALASTNGTGIDEVFKQRDDKALESQKKAEESRKKDLEQLQIDCDNQLLEFAKKDITFEFEKFVPLKEDVLVEIFKFIPSKEYISKSLLGRSPILLFSQLDGTTKESTTANNEQYLPIVRVIKVGVACSNKSIIPGSLYTVSVEDIEGYSFNPDYIWMMQNFAKQGQKNLTHIPADVPQRIKNIDTKWGKYRFNKPNLLKKEENEYRDIFLIPEISIKARYDVVAR